MVNQFEKAMRVAEEKAEREDQNRAFIFTIVVGGGVLLLLFLFVGWTYPDPAPAEEVIELLEPEGSQEGGSSQSDAASQAASASEQVEEIEETVQPETAEIQTETQDEASVEVAAADHVEDTPSDDPQEEFDPTRLYPGSSGSEDGDQAGGNTGTGSGTGSGNNTGPGHGSMGNGDWYLAGRGIVTKPVIRDQLVDQGTVVVDIIVDRLGKVVRANVNVSKSNTSSQELWDKAVSAAYKAKFTAKANATVEQKGSLTFNFISQ